MSNKGNQIGELLNKASAAAPDVTKPLKSIGDGNMLEGVKNIFNYALTEGEKTGLAKGEKIGLAKGSAITLGVCGILYLVPKGVKFVKKKIFEKKAHDEMSEKIYTAFSEELTDSRDEGGAVDEEGENQDA